MQLHPAFSRGLLFVLTAALALPAGALAAAASASPPSDAEIAREFLARRAQILDATVGATDPHDPAKGGMLDIAVNFYRHTNLGWANARLEKIDAAEPTGDMFWMYPMVTVMEAGRGVMSPANAAQIRELWRTYFPYRGDTENHWLIYYSSLYLAAQAEPGAGRDAWYNGKSSAENMAEARSYIEDWMKITTAHGQGEFDSPNYMEEYTAPLALLAGWAQDPQFRQEARMMLDYIFYGYAVQQLNGAYGGAHSRVYPWQVVQPGHSPAAAIGWLLFGVGENQPNGTIQILAMSGYTPPPILWRVAHDRAQPYVERELKRTRWRMRHAGPDAIEVEGKSTVPVYKYTYMDPDFVIGSCQGGLLQPIQQETWSLVWRTEKPLGTLNTFFGLQPYSSPHEGTMYFAAQWDTVTNLIARSKADYDSPDKLIGGSPNEQVFQHGPALIALYDLPPGTRFPHITTFFSRDLARRDPDPSGWIFCQGGPAYFAYRPLAPGEWKPMGWTGLLKDGAGGWFSAGYDQYCKGNECLVSDAPKNGYVVQVAPARDYQSFDDFKAAVRALPLTFSLTPVPEVTFTALDGSTLRARYGGTPTVNGTPPDYARWPLFDSPFGQAVRGSERLEIRHGPERLLLDFKKTAITDRVLPSAP